MEFEDVLVFNFFRDSNFTRWRLFLPGDDSKNNYHGFDEKKDFALSSELKALYVACTRSKCQLVFIDESPIVNPMIEWWSNIGTITRVPASSNGLRFAKESTKESWEERGDEFLTLKQLENAIICYIRAKNEAKLCRVQAILDERNADRALALKKTKESINLYLKAASEFLVVKDSFSAATCYLKAGEGLKAAELYYENKSILKALNCCLQYGLDSKALEFMTGEHSDADPSSLDRYARFFALMSRRLSKQSQMLQFLKFVSVGSARSFLKRYNEIEVLYAFDQLSENWDLAAESAELQQSYRNSFDFYVKANKNESAIELFLKYFCSSKTTFSEIPALFYQQYSRSEEKTSL
jgi:hypothetical protein